MIQGYSFQLIAKHIFVYLLDFLFSVVLANKDVELLLNHYTMRHKPQVTVSLKTKKKRTFFFGKFYIVLKKYKSFFFSFSTIQLPVI